RHLIEQRLKHVIVVAIQQRDAHRCMLECLRRPQAAEAATDDHHVGKGHKAIIGELWIADCGLGLSIEDWFRITAWPSGRISALTFRWRRPARSIARTPAAFPSASARDASSQWTAATPMMRRAATSAPRSGVSPSVFTAKTD